METEKRKSARKVLKTKVILALGGEGALVGRTSDLGANGVSVCLSHPLAAGQTGQVSFDIFVDGKLTRITARAKALYCIFSDGEFKVGFQFLDMELGATKSLARFLR